MLHAYIQYTQYIYIIKNHKKNVAVALNYLSIYKMVDFVDATADVF